MLGLPELALGAAALYFLLKGKTDAAPAAAAPSKQKRPPRQAAPQAASPATPSPPPAKPVPLSIVQPVSANAVPWPAVEQKLLAKPQNASTKRGATPVFNVKREDGSNPQTESAAMVVRERAPFDSSYWMSARKPTPAEVEQAKAYLEMGMWQPGAFWFQGPRTFSGRRQYRASGTAQKKSITIWQPKPPFV